MNRPEPKPAPSSSTDDPAAFYRDTVLQHSVEPVGFRAEIEPTHEAERYNPLCGDRVTLRFRVAGEQIEAAAFDGEACAICLASASLLCAKAPGQSIVQLEDTGEGLKALLEGSERTDVDTELRALSGVRRYRSRIRCALLPWEAAHIALSESPDADGKASPEPGRT